jgi:putative ABC transport system permease protein
MLFTYLARELRSRSKQAIVIAAGLGIGIALVITVSATSAGVKAAQGQVLHSLYGVGTDITVSQTAAAGSGGPQRFSFGGTPGGGTRPTAGTHFSRNTLSPTPGSATLAVTTVTQIAKVSGVVAASGGLSLNDTSISGTFGSFGGFGGGTTSASSGTPPPVSFSSFSVVGVQPNTNDVGPLTNAEVTSGRPFTSADNTSKVAILSSSYAVQNKLTLNSTITVAGTKLSVVGIASLPSGSTTDVFLPLGEAQTLAKLPGKITTVYVSAASASDVNAVTSAIQKAFPKATLTNASTLASEVTGSITSASTLATKLGLWISVAALAVAFLVAALLMMAAVSRRVREFGTLKALGWRTRRVVGQVMGEGLVQGVVGGIIGIGLGIGAASVVSAVAPGLTATEGSPVTTGGGFTGGGGFGSGGFGGGSGFGGSTFPRRTGGFATDLPRTVLVHLTAPIQGGSLLLAIGLAIAGGLVAGAFGAWRAARLRPAAALRRVE